MIDQADMRSIEIYFILFFLQLLTLFG